MSFADFLGTNLIKGKEIGDTHFLLHGKIIGLYFSAHWCGPCRSFTPRLAEIYNGYIEQGKNFEIVYVSSDKNQEAFDAYYAEMPWLALPFEERDQKKILTTTFKILGIPALVILDEDGSLITSYGREMVTEDPEGNEFPWRPKPFIQMLGTQFQGKEGMVDLNAIEGKYLGFFFSAHWCPPCRMFTPKLVAVYQKLKEEGKDFEIIFVSGDKNQTKFNDYYSEMPWLAIPFGDRRIRALERHFSVHGLPTFAIIDAEGRIINKNSRDKVDVDPEGSNFPWPPLPLEDFGVTQECMGYDFNVKPSLILMMEGVDDHEQDAMTALLEPIAAQYAQEGKETGDQSILFFTAKQDSKITKQIRKVCLLPETSQETTMLLLDIPDSGGFYVYERQSEISEDDIRNFVQNYKSGERKQLSRN
mmetsp:Transcript_38497/g.48597  ORF Transcript_38497/g.48597 Transcript_38497/m.48597 type:complete len:417 (+) Transcript_38497:142-1392(+)